MLVEKKFNELKLEERKEIAELFTNWLGKYTDEVIKKVLERADEIINNEMAMHLLRELKARDEKEYSELTDSIRFLMEDFESFSGHDARSTCLTHAKSYRDVLYDMYIR